MPESSRESSDILRSLLPSRETPLRAEMFVHSLAPVGSKQQQDELAERLRGLVDDDVLTDLDLFVWGDSICTGSALAEIGTGKHVVSAIGDFYALAATRDVSIAPFFRISKVTSSITDESFRRIVPPCRCLALYAEDELVSVFPCLVDGESFTPEDALDWLESSANEAVASAVLADEQT
ncbi:HTH domain-containing protein [Haloarcula marina]|uniref:HTH domain-containing protein n=1 Tax=Haloarcula marina TaxID=2961574 RepID=UPI0020B675EB|nr:HTH domain-containing protein [Halomicroarcula marina]